MHVGIYKITNVVNGKHYIGSSLNVKKRCISHSSNLKNKHHHNPHLQNAWNKYGKNSFTFEVLLYCDKEKLLFFEQRAIKEYKTLDAVSGYNCKTAERHELTGSNAKEWKRKIVKALKGKKVSKKTKLKRKLSKANKGKNHYMYGKHHSMEARRKMSESHKGHRVTDSTKHKLSKINKNKKLSDNHKRKISKVNRGKTCFNPKAVIICGIYYHAINEAVRKLKIPHSTIRYRIIKNKLGYAFA